jgi:hypothetical protein
MALNVLREGARASRSLSGVKNLLRCARFLVEKMLRS